MRMYQSAGRVPVCLPVVAVALLLCGPAWPDTPEQSAASVPAVWTAKEQRFVYMGFTSHYSCDGLRDKIRTVLSKLGARKDMQVTELACPGSLGRPTVFPGVSIRIHVLQPASAGAGAADSAPVQARWQRVQLAPDTDLVRAAGECELVEQIKQSILPLFTTRNVEYSSTCVPNQLTVGGTQLKADVLVAEQAPPAAAAPK